MDVNVDSFNLENLFSQSQELLALYGLKFIGAIAIFFIGRIAAKLVASAIKKGMNNRGVDDTVAGFAYNVVYAGLVAFVVVAALGQIGIQTASFIAILGAAGLAVGLALQGSLSNFAAGVLMVIFKPFKVGDFVEAGGASGSVQEIHIFSTILTTPDNKTIIIPNAGIMGSNITNYSMKDTRRVDLVIGVSYDASLPLTKSVLTDVIAKEKRVLKDVESTIAVSELADSSVNFVVRAWVNTADYWPVYFDLLEAIKIRLDEENIGIPYPQLDLHVANAEAFQTN
ncbi:MAG: mechanosensitive ion channel [Pseudomonadales bacterium]|nr:mechanosensitive ion channel [Pseudomonadales bacterium]